MKILLIQPPIRDFYQTSMRTQPIGLAYLAASLRTHGHSVEILDCRTDRKRPIPLPAELAYLQAYYPFNDRSPFKLYSGYYHFGMGWDEIGKRVEVSQADVFGISSSFTPYHGEALEIAGIIKQGDGRRIVVMGGAHVSCDPRGVLESPLVDYVVLGEGELRLPLLLEHLAKGSTRKIDGIDGIGYRVDGRVMINPLKTFVQDLDHLPHPARGLLDLDRYCIKKKRATMIITSRGCPHGCAYCSARLVMGASFRGRSPEGIIQEMLECRQRYGMSVFDIEDDNFTFDKGRAKRLLSLIRDTFGEGGLQLSAMNGISFASLDGELLGLMKQAGFKEVNLSLVSVDPAIKEGMQRPGGMAGFDAIAAEATRVGLTVIAYAILGMPGQTVAEMVDTLIYLMGRRVLIGPSVYYPCAGTALFELCRRERLLPPAISQWRSSAMPIETRAFNRLDIATLFRLARVINFIKGRMDKDELDEGMTWRRLSRVLKAHGKEKDLTWSDLLLLLINERCFFSLRVDPETGQSVAKETSSSRVLDYFFKNAWERPILKSRAD
ncbi:MAG: B12-binding domain-containing radical SAM protein [Desulfobacterales bacterium]|nr:B12-binding domain-containing radical SAM protein [Desulfobacterales bacterium]